MIGYTTLGTNDLDRAVTFYDKLFETEDVKRLQPNDRLHLWGKKGAPMFGVIKPYDGEPATSGNGTMIALAVESTEKVEQRRRRRRTGPARHRRLFRRLLSRS